MLYCVSGYVYICHTNLCMSVCMYKIYQIYIYIYVYIYIFMEFCTEMSGCIGIYICMYRGVYGCMSMYVRSDGVMLRHDRF